MGRGRPKGRITRIFKLAFLPVLVLVLTLRSQPASAQSELQGWYNDFKQVLEQIIKLRIAEGITELAADSSMALCYYYSDAFDRLQSGYWGGVPDALREGSIRMLGDLVYWYVEQQMTDAKFRQEDLAAALSDFLRERNRYYAAGITAEGRKAATTEHPQCSRRWWRSVHVGEPAGQKTTLIERSSCQAVINNTSQPIEQALACNAGQAVVAFSLEQPETSKMHIADAIAHVAERLVAATDALSGAKLRRTVRDWIIERDSFERFLQSLSSSFGAVELDRYRKLSCHDISEREALDSILQNDMVDVSALLKEHTGTMFMCLTLDYYERVKRLSRVQHITLTLDNRPVYIPLGDLRSQPGEATLQSWAIDNLRERYDQGDTPKLTEERDQAEIEWRTRKEAAGRRCGAAGDGTSELERAAAALGQAQAALEQTERELQAHLAGVTTVSPVPMSPAESAIREKRLRDRVVELRRALAARIEDHERARTACADAQREAEFARSQYEQRRLAAQEAAAKWDKLMKIDGPVGSCTGNTPRAPALVRYGDIPLSGLKMYVTKDGVLQDCDTVLPSISFADIPKNLQAIRRANSKLTWAIKDLRPFGFFAAESARDLGDKLEVFHQVQNLVWAASEQLSFISAGKPSFAGIFAATLAANTAFKELDDMLDRRVEDMLSARMSQRLAGELARAKSRLANAAASGPQGGMDTLVAELPAAAQASEALAQMSDEALSAYMQAELLRALLDRLQRRGVVLGGLTEARRRAELDAIPDNEVVQAVSEHAQNELLRRVRAAIAAEKDEASALMAKVSRARRLIARFEALVADRTLRELITLVERSNFRELITVALDVGIPRVLAHASGKELQALGATCQDLGRTKCQAYRNFLIKFAAYVLDSGGSDEGALLAREAFRSAAIDLIEKVYTKGYPISGVRILWLGNKEEEGLGKTVINWLVPDLSLRYSWNRDYFNQSGPDSMRLHITATTLHLMQWPLTKYVGGQVTLSDVTAWATELALREKGSYGPVGDQARYLIYDSLMRPRLDVWFGIPQITRNVAFTAGLSLRFLRVRETGMQTEEDDKTFDYDWSFPNCGGSALRGCTLEVSLGLSLFY